MATAALPNSGSYPIALSPSLFASTAGKRKRDDGEMVALKYAFKPGSMTASTETVIESPQHGAKVLRADTTSHGTQVFDVREEQSKARECVLVYDDATKTFALHALPTTVHLTLNRAASSSTARPGPSHAQSSASSSSSSSTSSSSQPLAQKARPEESTTREPASRTQGSQGRQPRQGDPPAEPARPSKGGKGPLARSGPPPAARDPAPAPAPDPPPAASGKGRGKNGAKKTVPPAKKANPKKTPKAPVVPQGKYKSAETIEDSDEEYDLAHGGGDNAAGGAPARRSAAATAQTPAAEVEEEDEFAKMLAEGLSEQQQQQQQQQTAYDEDDDEDDEDEEDDDEDDDELGGARLAVRQSAPGSGFGNGESEWL